MSQLKRRPYKGISLHIIVGAKVFTEHQVVCKPPLKSLNDVTSILINISRVLCLRRPNEDGKQPKSLYQIYEGGGWLLTRPEEEYRQPGITLRQGVVIEPERTTFTDYLNGSRTNIQVS